MDLFTEENTGLGNRRAVMPSVGYWLVKLETLTKKWGQGYASISMKVENYNYENPGKRAQGLVTVRDWVFPGFLAVPPLYHKPLSDGSRYMHFEKVTAQILEDRIKVHGWRLVRYDIMEGFIITLMKAHGINVLGRDPHKSESWHLLRRDAARRIVLETFDSWRKGEQCDALQFGAPTEVIYENYLQLPDNGPLF